MTEAHLSYLVRKKLKIGSVIKTHKLDFREGHEYEVKLVLAFYPHHVLTVCPETERFESYVYADIMKFLRGESDDSEEDT